MTKGASPRSQQEQPLLAPIRPAASLVVRTQEELMITRQKRRVDSSTKRRKTNLDNGQEKMSGANGMD
jgi:hypothetical protein